MIQQTLQFRYSPKPQRQVVAWFLQGDHPLDWLAEICQWNVDHVGLRLLPIPQSAANQQLCGLLVLLQDDSKQKSTENGLPYGVVESRLYLPVEATLHPKVTKAELQKMLSDEYTYVWHPACGIVAYEAKEELSVADLLTASAPENSNWNFATPGMAVSSRLRSLTLIKLPDLNSLFEEEQKEIGSDAKDIDKLPRKPGESMFGNIPNPLAYPAKWLAQGLLWATSHSPDTSDKETWINSVENFAMRMLSPMNSFNQSNRDQEINRLLHLLETDPDKGLKFALPMGGEGNHRGRAPASDWLSQQNVDFSSGNMHGGYAADTWDISHENQMKLLQQYRELANREIQLGHHRRAAYIFAHLLGDNHAAAQTLTAGHQWRDAAILYKEKLNQPIEAAKCLEQGGLWTEAIALYEELEDFEKVGDLQTELNRPEEATVAYRTAVACYEQKGWDIKAAHLLEEKLDATDEAVAILEYRWQQSSQSQQCLDYLFELLATHGRHEYAISQIDQLREHQLSTSQKIIIVDFLARTTSDYPDRNVRKVAEESTRVVVSQNLEQADRQQKRQLLNSLQQLVPADKLLLRDTQRFLKNVKQVRPRTQKPLGSNPFLLHSILFSPPTNWQKAVTDGTTIFAARYSQEKLMVRRATWDGYIDDNTISWNVQPSIINSPLIFSSGFHPQALLMTHAIGGNVDHENTFRQSFLRDDVFSESTTVGTLTGMTENVVSVARGIDGVNWLLESRNQELTIIAISQRGKLLSTNVIPFPEMQIFSEVHFVFPLPFVVRRGKLYFAVGSKLITYDNHQQLTFEEYHRPITSVVASAPNTNLRIALTFDQGGILLWESFGEVTSCSFADDMDDPVACFNREGKLIVAGSGRCEIYKTQNKKLELLTNFTIETIGTIGKPISILPAHDQNQFGLFDANGVVSVFQMR